MCKIADFGLARDIYEKKQYLKLGEVKIGLDWIGLQWIANWIAIIVLGSLPNDVLYTTS